MNTLTESQHRLVTIRDDLSTAFLEDAQNGLVVAVDTETTGLNWRDDMICSLQFALPDGRVEIIRVTDSPTCPPRVDQVMRSASVLKVFHHAMFDLRFMRSAWGVHAQQVACTKVAAKIVDPEGLVGHSLADLVPHYLGGVLDKTQQTSDWSASILSPEQVDYAAADVAYLVQLLHALLSALRSRGLEALALDCFRHLPARVELDVGGFGDVFSY